MPEWLVPFAGRSPSAAVRLNFLWRDGNAFVMDNHRAALWCWLQCLPRGTSCGLLHVDRHTDAAAPEADLRAVRDLDLWGLSLDGYLGAAHETDLLSLTPLFRWDNYLGLFLARHPGAVHDLAVADQGRGERPAHAALFPLEPWRLHLLDLTTGGPWIVNLDMDYFCFQGADGAYRPLFSPDFLAAALAPVVRARKAGQLLCLTLSLSPECCGGWPQAEALARDVCRTLEIDFSLPE